MTPLISNKRRLIAILLAWVIFIGFDFLFHASLFATFWQEEIPALKPLTDLALLIPAGYLSFLLLTALVGYVFFLVFKTKPPIRRVLYFGFVFAILFSLSNFFGLYSFIDLPAKHLLVFNLVYFVEILAVSLSLYYISFSKSLKKSAVYTILIFFGLLITGILIQNLFSFL
jgi:hypothetical protein